mgnify:CR=1 FL=1|tara:strand:+ start:94 stop:489 length:396 start_codon:yes stop_codon:yes gene_type:complete
MTTISQAITALGIEDWVLRGEPTNEEEFNAMFRKVTGADSNGSAIESDKPSDFGTTWKAVSDKKTELINAEPMRLLRVERDRLLAETDWTALGDVTMSDKMKTYRQELRDITKTFQSMSDKDFKFPDKPES